MTVESFLLEPWAILAIAAGALAVLWLASYVGERLGL